uniref:Metaxin-2 n=1 Tax=Cuerna arida TaxID=1464854 RepID=A0A1B6F1W0_9HEMI
MTLMLKHDTETMEDFSLVKNFLSNTREESGQGEKSATIWLNEAIIYQPITDQILLPDKASCLCLEAFMRMSNLNYRIISKKNVEYMSPSGKLPLLNMDVFLLSEFHTIVQFAEEKGQSLSKNLQAWERAELKSYISLVNMVLVTAENYITWVDQENFNKVTRIKHGFVHPWPLNVLLIRQKRQTVLNNLSALGWQDKTMEDVCGEVYSCCEAFSERLDEDYFFENRPTELDAVLFAHVYTIVTTDLPNNQLSCVIRSFPKIIKHCNRIIDKFFPEFNSCKFQVDINDDLLT